MILARGHDKTELDTNLEYMPLGGINMCMLEPTLNLGLTLQSFAAHVSSTNGTQEFLVALRNNCLFWLVKSQGPDTVAENGKPGDDCRHHFRQPRSDACAVLSSRTHPRLYLPSLPYDSI